MYLDDNLTPEELAEAAAEQRAVSEAELGRYVPLPWQLTLADYERLAEESLTQRMYREFGNAAHLFTRN